MPPDAERFKHTFARIATLHERHIVEVTSLSDLRYRIWMWSIGNPDLAVCTFNLMIPSEVDQLTDRERESHQPPNANGHSSPIVPSRWTIALRFTIFEICKRKSDCLWPCLVASE